MGRMFANGPGSHSAFTNTTALESAANQLKGCRSSQMHWFMHARRGILLFTDLTAQLPQLRTTCVEDFDCTSTGAENQLPSVSDNPTWTSPTRRRKLLITAVDQPNREFTGQARAFPYSTSKRLHAFSACGSL